MEQKASMETPLFLRMKDRKKNNHEKVIRYKTTEHVQNRKLDCYKASRHEKQTPS